MFSQPWMRYVALWGAVSLVASSQRGTITLAGVASNTATINSVDTTRAAVAWGGTSVNTTGNVDGWGVATLTNGTTVTASRGGTSSTMNVTYHVIEFAPGVVKSLQTGTLTNSATATVTEVDPNHSWLLLRGWTCNAAANQQSQVRIILTDGTTITSTGVFGSGETTTTYYTLAEFN